MTFETLCNVCQTMANEDKRESDLNEVVLQESVLDTQCETIAKKRPKRVLHFSDGDLEEYSSEDEVDKSQATKTVAEIDPRALNWIPWTWHQTTFIGTKLLDGCDYVGEWLANFFGITTPKYQFEIDEFHRLQALQNEMIHNNDLEMGGWNNQNRNNLINDPNLIKD
ncbi:PREDICTED: protein FAM177A1 [Polistes dominula]|uniref:Protein FAM177A1 n=1 Tax=Polistes dominula TaxID=743375 RepID=A0ABM1IYZ5_POLDO|nr:PREDICTED: protein FAM177A1 [Polistes dominula]